MKILIVDDIRNMRVIIRNVLVVLGYQDVDEASSGEEAIHMLRKEPYDMVISDWVMGAMSGYDLLKAVRSDADLKNMSFVMMTAEAQSANILDAKDAGVDAYIIKPFTAETLLKKLRTVLTPNSGLAVGA